MAEKAGDCAYSTLHLPNGEDEETTVLQSIFVIFILLCICVFRRITAAQKAENQERYTSHKKKQVQSDGISLINHKLDELFVQDT